MKWNEKDTFHKVVTVVGFLCAICYLGLQVLELIGILTGLKGVGYILWAVFCLSECVQFWNTQRKLACVWLVLCVLYLFSAIRFFV